MKKKRNYTKAFKTQACELVLNGSLQVKSVAERMGISHIMLYRWIDEYNSGFIYCSFAIIYRS